MAEIIDATALQVGDVFYDHRSFHGAGRGLREVDGVRTIKTVETYTVVDYHGLNTELKGNIHLRSDVQVMRVQRITTDEALVKTGCLQPGEELRLWRRLDGGFYA